MAKKRKDRGQDIEDVRSAEQAAGGAAKESAAERRRLLQIFTRKALAALQANDERAYAEQLRLAGVREDSPEWKAAWELYRVHHG